MKNNRCVIVGAAAIADPERIKRLFLKDDFFIYCDGGLYHTEKLGRSPDLIIGDFDSHERPETDVETIVLPHEKDDTDTFYAVKEAIKRGFEEYLLVGVIGQRLDHTLGNLSALLYLDSLGKKAAIADDFSIMKIISGGAEIDGGFSYFSLLSLTESARDITVTGAKYPLDHAEMTQRIPYGVSNEVTPGETARVTCGEGKLLLIKVF